MWLTQPCRHTAPPPSVTESSLDPSQTSGVGGSSEQCPPSLGLLVEQGWVLWPGPWEQTDLPVQVPPLPPSRMCGFALGC